MTNSSLAWVIGTVDTKYEELTYVSNILKELDIPHLLVDVSTTVHPYKVDIAATDIAKKHQSRPDFLDHNEGRGDAIACMTDAFSCYTSEAKPLAVLGLGGSGGTAIISAGMRSLPIGVPKVMVSTVASGQVSSYVGASDIFMLYSITDIAGINQISHLVLSNAAHALAGMIQNSPPVLNQGKPLLGMTMFGVTTPAVTYLREQLKSDFEPLVFHATGTGGKSMEKLVSSGLIKHVIDLTTTEICDLLMGGIMSAGETRMDAIINAGIPYFLSTGALDMVNFADIESVPDKYKSRNLYRHNPQVTLMRTTPDENVEMGKWIAKKLNRSSALAILYLPEKGTSSLSTEGNPFYDPEADAALFDTLEKHVIETENRRIKKLPFHINDPGFLEIIIDDFWRSFKG